MESQNVQSQNILQNSPINAFQECLHSCINDICGRKMTSYESFKSVTNWTSEEFEFVTIFIKELFIDAVVNQWTKDKILEKIPNLDTDRKEIVLQCFEVRQTDIQNVLLQETCAISGPTLQDFDWKIKWVMGSSKLSSLREPLLSLDFHLTEGKNVKTQVKNVKQKTVSIELDKNELNKMIAVLEKAQDSVSNWQT